MTTHSTALVLRAERAPEPGVARPGPHQLYRWPKVDVEERPLGALLPDHVRVEVKLAGVCGSDLHATRAREGSGYIVGSVPLELNANGRVLGHEGFGRIVAVGERVRGFSVGRLVVFESIVTCQTCSSCRRGHFNNCLNARLVGMEVDGLFRTVADLPAALAHDVTELATSPTRRLALTCCEPASCALLAARELGVAPAERVVVFGAGPIGLFAAMVCQQVLGATVEVVEPIAARRERAAQWASRCYDVDEFFEGSKSPIDVVIEASGVVGNVDRVLPRLGPRARVGLLARSGAPLQLAHVDQMISNGIRIQGVRGHLCGVFDDVLALIHAGKLPVERAVTGVLDGLPALAEELVNSADFEHRHAKLLARIGED